MLKITGTSNQTGITISGDYQDLYEVNESIHDLVGFEQAYSGYENVGMNCLGLAYDIRHAYMGTREIMTIDNGVHREMQKWHGKILPQDNVYYCVNVVWTEAMFVVLALNDFIELAADPKTYAQILKELPEELAVEKKKSVDYAIAVVKLFQSLVWREFRCVVGDNRYSRIYKKTLNRYTYIKNLKYQGFCTQYIDELTCGYVATAIDKRPAKLAKYVTNMIESPRDYLELASEIQEYAREHNINAHEVRLSGLEYPEEIVW